MVSSSSLKASTVDSGFILNPGELENPLTSDPFFQRVLNWYLPSDVLDNAVRGLTKFGDEAISSEIHAWIANAEKDQPYVKQYDVWGRRYPYDKLVTSHGWKKLGEWGARNGFVAIQMPYRRQESSNASSQCCVPGVRE